MERRFENPLLRFFHAVLHRDHRAAGFEGTVAIGVARNHAPTEWLYVELGESPAAVLLHVRPHADVLLLLDAASAEAIVREGRLADGGFAHVEGDATLLRRFVDRYTRSAEPVKARRASSFGSRVWRAVRRSEPHANQAV